MRANHISLCIYFIISFFLIGNVFAKSVAHVPGAKPGANGAKPAVTVTEVKSVLLSKQLTYPARVVPEVNVAVLSEIDGVVTRVVVDLGQIVQKGTPLVAVQHNEPGYQYKPMMVLAPISGVISLVDVNPGASVTKGQKLVVITDPKRIYVGIEVAASDLSLVSTGLVGKLFLSTSPDRGIPMKITGISPLIDSATGTASSQLRLVKSEDLVYLKPGLVGQISFDVNQHKGIEVPESALVYRSKDTFVRTIQNGKIKEVKVTVGETHKGQVEVLSGLKEKDVMVLRTSAFLTDGLEVTVEKEGERKP